MHTFIAVQSAAAQFPHLTTVLGGHLSALAAGPTPPAGGGGGINTGNPGEITAFFQAWSDAAKKWMPFLLIFGVIIGYLLMTFGSRLGGEHMRNQILAGFAVLFVIAIAPGIFQ